MTHMWIAIAGSLIVAVLGFVVEFATYNPEKEHAAA